MSRPFGVALLLAGYDDKGPQLFFSDPSGTFTRFKAKAIGMCVGDGHTCAPPPSQSFETID